MQDTAKYLIHANITASGVVERSDVVGAIFGQTEGLLGDELDLRELQDSAKLGRIDVEIESEGGRSFGEVTIASGLDRVETAILAAALETIERVGPCRATIEVTELEDVRKAKRRALVERAKDLLATFDESVQSTEEMVEEVRRSARVEHITEYEGYPAGPRVADSDAIVVVEGRADVLRLLEYGIKNAVAVEGTDVPDAIARLTTERTVTTFLDGDRGGDLILKELAQVGDVDFVAYAPAGQSVEDLSRDVVMRALREKVAYEDVADAETPHEVVTGEQPPAGTSSERDTTGKDSDEQPSDESDEQTAPTAETDTGGETDAVTDDDTTVPEADGDDETDEDLPLTLSDHIGAVIDQRSGHVRLLDEGLNAIGESEADDAFDAVANAEHIPATVLLDGELDQRLLDVAAQRGVGQIVARSEGQFVKKPASVRVRTVA
jgi:DNA primase